MNMTWRNRTIGLFCHSKTFPASNDVRISAYSNDMAAIDATQLSSLEESVMLFVLHVIIFATVDLTGGFPPPCNHLLVNEEGLQDALREVKRPEGKSQLLRQGHWLHVAPAWPKPGSMINNHLQSLLHGWMNGAHSSGTRELKRSHLKLG